MLPAVLKARLDELLRSGIPQTRILEQLAPLLAEAGERPVTRSALSRHAIRMEQVGQRIRQAREVADAWTAKFGEQPTGEVGTQVIEILRTIAFELSVEIDSEHPRAAETMGHLALTVQRLERASSLGAARERALRAEVAASAGRTAEQAAARQGLSADGAAAIRQAIEQADL